MLELKRVTKRFGNFLALDRIDLRVRPGEVVALVGANGAGKSTLAKVLAGLHPDASFTCEMDGRAIDLSSPAAALKARIAVVYQETDLIPDFTVAENMLLGRELGQGPSEFRWLRRGEIQRRAAEVLQAAGLTALDPQALVAELDLEARQLVQIAQAWARDARLFVFDESTARLGRDARERLFALIARLREAQRMVVFVSHHLEEVFATSDRIVVLREGRVVGDSPTREIEVARIVEMMVGHVARGESEGSAEAGRTVLTVTGMTSEPFFRDVGFDVRAGEVLGLAGLVGSGRREIIRALIGELRASGSARVIEQELIGRSTHDIIGACVGFVPEDRVRDGVVPVASVAANISLPWLRRVADFMFAQRRALHSAAVRIAADLRIVARSLSQNVGDLSGGNQQKVVLGRWFERAPQVVLLESPTVGVDIAGKEEIRGLARALARTGVAIIVSTDDLWELEQFTDRVVVVSRGRLTREFRSRPFPQADILAAIIGLPAEGRSPSDARAMRR